MRNLRPIILTIVLLAVVASLVLWYRRERGEQDRAVPAPVAAKPVKSPSNIVAAPLKTPAVKPVGPASVAGSSKAADHSINRRGETVAPILPPVPPAEAAEVAPAPAPSAEPSPGSATTTPPEPVPLGGDNEYKTIDFTSGKPVVKDSPEDKAAIDSALKDFAEAAKDVTFGPPKKKAVPPPANR